jgi:hypothetical protein
MPDGRSSGDWMLSELLLQFVWLSAVKRPSRVDQITTANRCPTDQHAKAHLVPIRE